MIKGTQCFYSAPTPINNGAVIDNEVCWYPLPVLTLVKVISVSLNLSCFDVNSFHLPLLFPPLMATTKVQIHVTALALALAFV